MTEITGPASLGWAAPDDEYRAAFARLAAPFPPGSVEKLPKQLRKGDDNRDTCSVANRGVCADASPCGGWHARSIHLDYIGHAGVTMRLNEVDPTWTWEPMALGQYGTPLMTDGGLWIRLTVLGVTRLGFGDAGAKQGPNAVKEIIGDAIRNAAMRFGVGTYLWSKSEDAQVIAAGGDPLAGDREQPAPAAPVAPPPPVQGPSGAPTPPPPSRPADDRPAGDAVSKAEALASDAQELANRAGRKRTVATLAELYEEAKSKHLLRVRVRVPEGEVELYEVITDRKQVLLAAEAAGEGGGTDDGAAS